VSRSFIAIADGRGVDPHTGTPMRYGKYRDGYHWYYMSEQTEEDVPLFKTYDSDQSVPSTTCLRTTFNIPNTTTETVSQTIEVQALIFTHPVSEQTAQARQSGEEVKMLRRRITVLSDEISQSQAFVKAGLDLRQWESRNTAEQIRRLISDRDHSRAEVLSLSMQLVYLENWITNIYIAWSSSSHFDPTLERMQHLICSTPRLRQRLGQDEQAYPNHVQSRGPEAEILLLHRLNTKRLRGSRLASMLRSKMRRAKRLFLRCKQQSSMNVASTMPLSRSCARRSEDFMWR
jgi:hypothetical protein